MGQDIYIAPPPPRQSRNWSCCLWGCLIAFIFLILLSIALVLIGRSSLTAIREKWTSTEPQQLPTVQIEEHALDDLVTRVDGFADRVEKRELSDALVLSQDELNALIQHHPDWEDLHDKVYVEIEGDLIKGMVNFPLTGIPMMSGRYLHGSVTFDLSLEDGRLEVYIDNATVNGEPVPEDIMAAFRRQNLAQDILRDNPDARAVVDQLESIRVENGSLIIVPKRQSTGTTTETPAEAPAETPAEAPIEGETDLVEEHLEETESVPAP